ncbi:hypothetical protein KOR34_34440 [Posidoniimonas corsicana]|uniref:Uncharacterized protein n=1 Tax=Posidoniimonas corsicana TaxID=1938618 RepID=A0A5C5V7A6_9BACT|nr:hypothetical protein KOR34_34440 [Posidoniimonas corsicana]
MRQAGKSPIRPRQTTAAATPARSAPRRRRQDKPTRSRSRTIPPRRRRPAGTSETARANRPASPEASTAGTRTGSRCAQPLRVTRSPPATIPSTSSIPAPLHPFAVEHPRNQDCYDNANQHGKTDHQPQARICEAPVSAWPVKPEVEPSVADGVKADPRGHHGNNSRDYPHDAPANQPEPVDWRHTRPRRLVRVGFLLVHAAGDSLATSSIRACVRQSTTEILTNQSCRRSSPSPDCSSSKVGGEETADDRRPSGNQCDQVVGVAGTACHRDWNLSNRDTGHAERNYPRCNREWQRHPNAKPSRGPLCGRGLGLGRFVRVVIPSAHNCSDSLSTGRRAADHTAKPATAPTTPPNTHAAHIKTSP